MCIEQVFSASNALSKYSVLQINDMKPFLISYSVVCGHREVYRSEYIPGDTMAVTAISESPPDPTLPWP